jgi:hypothetical protein
MSLSIECLLHDEINATKLFDTLLNSGSQTLRFANIDTSNTEDFGTWSARLHIFCNFNGLGGISTDNACIGTQIDHGSNLPTAYWPSSASAKDHLVVYRVSIQLILAMTRHDELTENPLPPHVADIFILVKWHLGCREVEIGTSELGKQSKMSRSEPREYVQGQIKTFPDIGSRLKHGMTLQ